MEKGAGIHPDVPSETRENPPGVPRSVLPKVDLLRNIEVLLCCRNFSLFISIKANYLMVLNANWKIREKIKAFLTK